MSAMTIGMLLGALSMAIGAAFVFALAARSGQLEQVEEAKYQMLHDDILHDDMMQDEMRQGGNEDDVEVES